MRQLLLLLLFFIIAAVFPPSLFAQSTVPSPYCLGSCPTATTLFPTTQEHTITAPSQTLTAIPTTAATTVITPCETASQTVRIQQHQVHTKSATGAIGNFMSFFLQLIMQLLNSFLQIPGGGGGTIPQQPDIPGLPTQALNPTTQPTAAPCQPTIAPTQATPTGTTNPTTVPTQPARVTTTPTGTTGAITPPPGGPWALAFQDEFDGTTVDTTKWSFTSSAESTCDNEGCSNPGNQQLEYNSGANCSVTGGILTITARKENKGGRSWTSCMLHSKPQFQYMYMEERTKLPAKTGFWPAFWTWNGPSQEVDVYEYYSDNHTKLYMTSHAGGGGGCNWTPTFDPSADYHVYAADIEQGGVTFYVDGKQVCTANGTLSQQASILVDLFVYEKIPPLADTTSETKLVDYVRVWKK